jgi:hypothetical protein
MLFSRHTKRREFIAGLAGTARVQQAASQVLPAIGFVYTGAADASTDRVRAFRKGLGAIPCPVLMVNDRAPA